ncbi:GIY-YIG nuclease family protein [uncultured Williamsia sp.]|uniref:GIY-YIG nuclease family protein n=1 Tax=uncultured Williamsia sp. TaxID=259311 RepID=UPI00262B462B|nr:GIY-YIG nuclease family protein [uncultured Williamsia sp.]
MTEATIKADIAALLKRYVYALVDPLNGEPFYIGKGTEARVLQHGWDADKWASAVDESKAGSADDSVKAEQNSKLARISEIRSAGHEPEIWILRYGLTPEQYSLIESTAIDLLLTFPVAPLVTDGRRSALVGGTPLTNKVRGADAAKGIVRLIDLVREFSAPDLTSDVPLLLVTLGPWDSSDEVLPGGGRRSGHGFKPEWTDPAVLEPELNVLGESVCCWWKMSEKHVEEAGIEHMVACYRGVTRGLFEIEPGSLGKAKVHNSFRKGYTVSPVKSGTLWDEVVGPNGHRIPKKKRGEQAQFRYWPF